MKPKLAYCVLKAFVKKNLSCQKQNLKTGRKVTPYKRFSLLF